MGPRRTYHPLPSWDFTAGTYDSRNDLNGKPGTSPVTQHDDYIAGVWHKEGDPQIMLATTGESTGPTGDSTRAVDLAARDAIGLLGMEGEYQFADTAKADGSTDIGNGVMLRARWQEWRRFQPAMLAELAQTQQVSKDCPNGDCTVGLSRMLAAGFEGLGQGIQYYLFGQVQENKDPTSGQTTTNVGGFVGATLLLTHLTGNFRVDFGHDTLLGPTFSAGGRLRLMVTQKLWAFLGVIYQLGNNLDPHSQWNNVLGVSWRPLANPRFYVFVKLADRAIPGLRVDDPSQRTQLASIDLVIPVKKPIDLDTRGAWQLADSAGGKVETSMVGEEVTYHLPRGFDPIGGFRLAGSGDDGGMLLGGTVAAGYWMNKDMRLTVGVNLAAQAYVFQVDDSMNGFFIGMTGVIGGAGGARTHGNEIVRPRAPPRRPRRLRRLRRHAAGHPRGRHLQQQPRLRSRRDVLVVPARLRPLPDLRRPEVRRHRDVRDLPERLRPLPELRRRHLRGERDLLDVPRRLRQVPELRRRHLLRHRDVRDLPERLRRLPVVRRRHLHRQRDLHDVPEGLRHLRHLHRQELREVRRRRLRRRRDLHDVPEDCGVCPKCGDGKCTAGETCSSCPADCGVCPHCGDGVCLGTETCSTCAADCGKCLTCGDGECDGAEDCTTCQRDCGRCQGRSCGDGICGRNEVCGGATRGRISCDADCCGCDHGDCTTGTPLKTTCSSCAAKVCATDASCCTTQWDSVCVGYAVELCGEACGSCKVDGVCDAAHGETCGSCPQDCGKCTSGRCGDGVCGPGESCLSCAVDCGKCTAGCGDGICGAGETCTNCSTDCGECSVCGDGSCDGDETCTTCPKDCGTCTGTCGDGICQTTESCTTCPADCGLCASCGDGTCQTTESCASCPTDCGACPPSCGDGTCDPTETCTSCPIDCGSCAPVCGDGTCDPDTEDCTSCPQDCGACPPVCGDGTCNPGETCATCPIDCGTCAPVCGDSVCNGTETCASCPGDCGACPVCGDGVCNGLENCNSCPADCGTCTATCGNHVCDAEAGETCATCPGDCGTCGECPHPLCTAGAPLEKTCSPCAATVCALDSFCCMGKWDSECVTEAGWMCSVDCTTCGNGTCDPGETCATCADCGTCAGRCGDGVCDPDESCSTCPFDCGPCAALCGDHACDYWAGENCKDCAADCGACPAGCGDGTCAATESCATCPLDCGPCPTVCGDGNATPSAARAARRARPTAARA